MKTSRVIFASLLFVIGAANAQDGITDLKSDMAKVSTLDGVGNPIQMSQYMNASFGVLDNASGKADIATRFSMGDADPQAQSFYLEGAVITTRELSDIKFSKGQLIVTPDGRIQLIAKRMEVDLPDGNQSNASPKSYSMAYSGVGAPVTPSIVVLPPRGTYTFYCTKNHLNINNVTYGAGEHVCIGQDEYSSDIHGTIFTLVASSACN